jgi:subtilisin family serine protease
MKRIVGLVIITCALLQAETLIEPQLIEQMNAASGSEQIPVLIALDAEAVPDGPATRVDAVSQLKRFAAETQSPLLGELQELGAGNVEPLWIVNAVSCRLTRTAILQLAEHPDIAFIQRARLPVTDPFEWERSTAPADRIGKGWHITKTGADSAWTLLSVRGDSITVGVIDTGVNYNHVDLASHLWTDPNYPHHGWNFEQNNDDPMDDHGHGTFMAGLVASDGTAGETCGVAPRAQIMGCRVAVTVDTIAENELFAAVQFCLAPPLSPAHGADLILMPLSWMYSWNPRRALWRQTLANAAAAGRLMVCPGRGGLTPPDDIAAPADCPPPWLHPANQPGGLSGALCVTAVDNNDVRASFAAVGPVTWQAIAPFNDYTHNPGPGLIKPDVTAPGVNMNSLSNTSNNGYTNGWSGNSLATSIAAGVMALMHAKAGSGALSPAASDSLLEMTVKPLGTPPKNNQYGTGRVSAYQAVLSTPCNGVTAPGPAVPGLTPEGLRCTPNPVVVRTTIGYSLPVGAVVELGLYDLNGRLVRILAAGLQSPGQHEYVLERGGLAPGVYFCTLQNAGQRTTARLVLN